jgi:uncharacterized repeat protein (TIGR01451 family)
MTTAAVEFGLVPVCYGAYTGQVTDSVTGKGVPYAVVVVLGGSGDITADAQGFFTITNISLGGSDNQPEYYELEATRSNYWVSYTNAYAVCDTTNTVNLQILGIETGSLTGTLTAEGGAPLTNAYVTATYEYSQSVPTTNGGAFSFPSLTLGNDNATINYSVSSQPAGYWPVYTNVYIQADSNAVVNLVAIPICYDTVSGKVIYTNTSLPASGVSIELSTSTTYYTTTDANGNYTVTNVEMGTDNASTPAYVQAYGVAGYNSGSASITLTNCGQGFTEPTIGLQPIPVITNNYGMVTGQVFDVQTLSLIKGVEVFNPFYGTYAYTDTNGFYTVSNVLVGTDATTNTYYELEAISNGYFTVVSNVEVFANETSTQDFYLLRVGYGFLDGIVLDQSTGLPVQGASVNVSGATNTGPTGEFYSSPIALNYPNAPTYQYLTVLKTGYWTTNITAYVTNSATNFVTIDLLPVCTGATILGNVINASSQLPIAGVEIYLSDDQSTFSDANGNFIITNITVGNDNSPEQVSVTAEKTGFITQTKTVTIFCGASINTEFGVPETVFGAIDGYVTNAVTGAPLTNVFIGTSYGGTTNTDTNGYYLLTDVPILVSNQTWTVTADPSKTYGYPAQTKSTLVTSNITNEVDFGFGAQTALIVTLQQTPSNAIPVGADLLYTINLTNTTETAANVVLTDLLPPNVQYVKSSVTNPPGGLFTTPSYANGTVTTSASSFDAGEVVSLYITVVASSAGNLTNIINVGSSTTNLAPSTVTNAVVTNAAIAATIITNYADLAVGVTAVPNPVPVGNQLTYTLNVTNFGPADAPDVYVTNIFPPSVTFSSTSASSYTLIPNGLVWSVGDLNPDADTTIASTTIIVVPGTAGEITDTATVAVNWESTNGNPELVVIDTNLANNTASVTTLVTAQVATNTSLTYGSNIFNPQTGLFDQTVTFVNESGSIDANVLVEVLNLPANVQVYNKTGVTNKIPYVAYNQAIGPGSNVVFLIEYYEANRQPFLPTNFVALVSAVIPTVTTPTGSATAVTVQFESQGQVTIEFPSQPGHTYVVEYSTSISGPWVVSTPPIVAVNTRTQWIDSGPPVTTSPPGYAGARYYQIVKTK